MMDIGAAERPTRGAWATGLNRLLVLSEAGITDVKRPVGGEGLPGAAGARWEHAIEHVDTARDGFDDVVRLADTHEVARLVGWKHLNSKIEATEHRLLSLPDGETPDRITIKANSDQRLG